MPTSFLKDLYTAIEFYIFSLNKKMTKISKHLIRDGYYVDTYFLESVNCDLLRDQIDDIIKSNNAKIWKDDIESDVRIYGMEALSESIAELIDLEAIFSQAKNYLGKKIKYYFVLGARLQYKEKNIGSGGGWHRDSAFSNQMKVIVYLSDVNTENGPFEYIKNSHTTTRKFLHFFKGLSLKQTRFDKSDIGKIGSATEFVGRKGTAIYVNTRGIHRGKPISSSARYAITFYMFTKEPPSGFNDHLQKPPTMIV